MLQQIFLIVLIFFIASCQDKPFKIKVLKKTKNETPNFQVNSAIADNYVATKNIALSGKVSGFNPNDNLMLRYHGSSENNKNVKGIKKIYFDENDRIWHVRLDENIPQGKYKIEIINKNKEKETIILQEEKIIIDFEPPSIERAKENGQKPFIKEFNQYQFENIEDQYLPIPKGQETNLWAQNGTPSIKRWANRLNHKQSAPSYLFAVKDNVSLKHVKYSIAKTCANKNEATNSVDVKNDQAEILIIQKNSSINLRKLKDEELCLSIWASDEANNTINHTVKFVFSAIAPPLEVTINARNYRTATDSFDIGNKSFPLESFIRFNRRSAKILANTVIGHAIIYNPYNFPVEINRISLPSFELHIKTKKRIRSEQKYINTFPKYLVGPNWDKSHAMVTFNNPFSRTSPYNMGRLNIIYDRICKRNEIAIYSNQPSIEEKEAWIAFSQKINCLFTDKLPTRYFESKPFGQGPGDYTLSENNYKIIIEPEYLKSKAFSFDEENEVINSSLIGENKINLIRPNQSVALKISLKKVFPIKVLDDDRSQDLCSTMAFAQQMKYKNRFFGACQFGIIKDPNNHSRYCEKQCRPNILFETVESTVLTLAKQQKDGNETTKKFGYEINIKQIPSTKNYFEAKFNWHQNNRRRTYKD